MFRNCFLFFAVSVLLASCMQTGIEENSVNVLDGSDGKPPVLLSVKTESSNVVRLEFNEPVAPYGNSFDACDVHQDGCDIVLSLKQNLKAGKCCRISGRVCDLQGNSCNVSVNVWGRNENPAGLVINEFTTKGTAKNPDRTELKVVSDGNIAGFAMYDGIPGNYRSMVVFDDTDVCKGDFIVVWWTTSASDGTLYSGPRAVDVCAGSETGLSENNGIITLSDSPSEGANVIDCLAYSNGESSQYGGFGTKEVQTRIETAKENKWLTADIVSPVNSTATRSVSRKADGTWYVTVTGGSTFGYENTSDAY